MALNISTQDTKRERDGERLENIKKFWNLSLEKEIRKINLNFIEKRYQQNDEKMCEHLFQSILQPINSKVNAVTSKKINWFFVKTAQRILDSKKLS